jgi:two-component system, LuxR family, response regulator FixJ
MTKGSRGPGPVVPVLLVVDDDEAVLNSLKFCLEIEGFAVRLYRGARALLSEPDWPAVGCLVVDHHMPGMTGLELVARLRSDGVALPAILITGHPGATLRRRAAEAGVTLIEKPLLGNGLGDAIRQALGQAD